MRHILICAALALALFFAFPSPAHAAKVIKANATAEDGNKNAVITGIAPPEETAQEDGKLSAMTAETGVWIGTFKTTGYSNPNGNKSADGSMPRAGHTVASDWSVIPKGSKIRFGDSDIIYTVEDTGVHGTVVDVYYDDVSSADAHGVQYKEVYLLP